MILSEYTRRWYEIKFYYFILDLYHLNNNMLDVVLTIEALAQLNNNSIKELKATAGIMISDPYYLPTTEEVVILGEKHGLSIKDLTTYLKKSRRTIHRYLSEKKDSFLPIPKCTVKEAEQIKKFFETLETLKKAGI